MNHPYSNLSSYDSRRRSYLQRGDGIIQLPALESVLYLIHLDAPARARSVRLYQELCTRLGLTGRPAARENLHITLYPFGRFHEYPAALADAAIAAASEIRMPPFEAEFDRVMSFGRRAEGPLVLAGSGAGIAPLLELHEALGHTMRKAGLPEYVRRRFTPHVTLSYRTQHVPSQPIEPIRWKVGGFELTHSRVTLATHLRKGWWPLDMPVG